MSLLISIIIPVYNVGNYLRQCLDSIFEQDADNFEVICINDGSTDGSLSILEEYNAKYDNLIILNQGNSGTGVARNAGINVAKGEYLWFIDSDDWILPQALAILVEKLSKSKSEILCFSGKLKYEDSGREEQDNVDAEEILTGWEYYNKYALMRKKFHFVCVVLRLYKRNFLLDNYLLFEPGISHEDNLWTPQVLYYAKSVECISEVLYVYRIRQGSKMQTISEEKVFDKIKVANKLLEFFISKSDVNKKIIYKDLSTYYPNILVIARISQLPNIIEKCYENFDIKNYKVVTKNTIAVVYYYMLKYRSSLIFYYPQISKILRKMNLN